MHRSTLAVRLVLWLHLRCFYLSEVKLVASANGHLVYKHHVVQFLIQDQIGISDINTPHFGEAVDIKEGEIPVFWACGVTPQAVVMKTK